MEEAIAKAKTARTEILANMGGCLAKEREEMSPYAPRIVTIPIDPSKIGELIGPGGKNIKRIVEESGCEINIEDDGRVLVYSMSAEGLQVAKDCIEGITAEVEVGKLYRGKVVSIKDFGCFVEVLPGKDGLVPSGSWPTFASRRPRISSRTATRSGSSASAWTTRVASSSRARLRWRSARPSSVTMKMVGKLSLIHI